MQHATESRSKGFFRSSPSTAFDQYLQDIQKLPLISDAEEERRLARRAQKGDELAAERLVTANLRFVISYVKKYQGHGLDLSELVAIGNEGLLKAVRKFDPDQGVKFISYAVWWVRQAVLKALAEQTRSVRIPLNQNSQLIKLARAETVLAQVLKRDPTESEIGRLLEETPEAVRAAKQMSATEVSLDAPIDRSDREASTLGERFAGVDGSHDVRDSNAEGLRRLLRRKHFERRRPGADARPGGGRPAYVGPPHDEVPRLMLEVVEWLDHGDPDAPDQERLLVTGHDHPEEITRVEAEVNGYIRQNTAVETRIMPPEAAATIQALSSSMVRSCGYRHSETCALRAGARPAHVF